MRAAMQPSQSSQVSNALQWKAARPSGREEVEEGCGQFTVNHQPGRCKSCARLAHGMPCWLQCLSTPVLYLAGGDGGGGGGLRDGQK